MDARRIAVRGIYTTATTLPTVVVVVASSVDCGVLWCEGALQQLHHIRPGKCVLLLWNNETFMEAKRKLCLRYKLSDFLDQLSTRKKIPFLIIVTFISLLLILLAVCYEVLCVNNLFTGDRTSSPEEQGVCCIGTVHGVAYIGTVQDLAYIGTVQGLAYICTVHGVV